MGRQCVVKGCRTGSCTDKRFRERNGLHQLSMFSTPKYKNKLSQWSESLQQLIVEKTYVCELHFSDADIKQTEVVDIDGKTIVILMKKKRLINNNVLPKIQAGHKQNTAFNDNFHTPGVSHTFAEETQYNLKSDTVICGRFTHSCQQNPSPGKATIPSSSELRPTVDTRKNIMTSPVSISKKLDKSVLDFGKLIFVNKSPPQFGSSSRNSVITQGENVAITNSANPLSRSITDSSSQKDLIGDERLIMSGHVLNHANNSTLLMQDESEHFRKSVITHVFSEKKKLSTPVNHSLLYTKQPQETDMHKERMVSDNSLKQFVCDSLNFNKSDNEDYSRKKNENLEHAQLLLDEKEMNCPNYLQRFDKDKIAAPSYCDTIEILTCFEQSYIESTVDNLKFNGINKNIQLDDVDDNKLIDCENRNSIIKNIFSNNEQAAFDAVYRENITDKNEKSFPTIELNTNEPIVDEKLKHLPNVSVKKLHAVFQSNVIEEKEDVTREINESVSQKTPSHLEIKREQQLEKFSPLQDILFTNNSKTKFCICCLRVGLKFQGHPIFRNTKFCFDCTDEYTKKICIFEKGINKYCLLCANEGNMQVCHNQFCTWTFCKICANNVLFKPLTEKDECYLCNPKHLQFTVFAVKDNWRENMLDLIKQMFDSPDVTLLGRLKNKTDGIVVLSLFDGISSGYVALKLLNIKVKKYYSSEICEKALAVSQDRHFGDGVIVYVGNAKEITKDKIIEMGPVDLLLGGSPCNELSRTNKDRKGFARGSSARLIFTFKKIRNWIIDNNEHRHLWWILENTACMNNSHKLVIDSCLGTKAKVLDAIHFSCQRRRRYWWTNLPWGRFLKVNVDLQDHLIPHTGEALVKKIRTVTTKSASLKQKLEGKQVYVKPIRFNNKRRNLYVQELEVIFGLPENYTDARDLTVSERRALLGKGWSIQCIMQILTPLKAYFN